jgi:hypothetical protein
MPDDIEVQQQLLQDSRSAEEWVLRTQNGKITFRMTRAPRTLRARAQNALPDEFFATLEEALPEDAELDALTFEDLDLENINLHALVLPPAAVEALKDVLVAALDHDQLVDSEIREIVEALPDETFYEAAFQALEQGSDTEAIESFRQVG